MGTIDRAVYSVEGIYRGIYKAIIAFVNHSVTWYEVTWYICLTKEISAYVSLNLLQFKLHKDSSCSLLRLK